MVQADAAEVDVSAGSSKVAEKGRFLRVIVVLALVVVGGDVTAEVLKKGGGVGGGQWCCDGCV